MKMTVGTGYGARSCAVEAAKNMTVAGAPAGLERDTLAYAACRFLTKSGAMCRAWVNESYRLRFARGREKRVCRHRCTAPAALLELPGTWVRLRLSVSARGVTVEELRFLPEEISGGRP